jgi:hypothetical protein
MKDEVARGLIEAALARYDAQCRPSVPSDQLLEYEDRLAEACERYRRMVPRGTPAPRPQTTVRPSPNTRSTDGR